MAVDDEIQSLKRRKLELSTYTDSLTASAEQLAERQQVLILVTWASSWNQMQCKEKTAETTELDKQLADKLLELKNCE